MKTIRLWQWILLLIISRMIPGEAAVVRVGEPGVNIGYRQPIQAILVDTQGNAYEYTLFYNPVLGGVDIDPEWAGPHASIFFPNYGTRYIWFNGAWVDENGYYLSEGRLVPVRHPFWEDYWTRYWNERWLNSWRYTYLQDPYYTFPTVDEQINTFPYDYRFY